MLSASCASNILGIQSSRGTSDLTSLIFIASWQLSFWRYNAPNFERFCWPGILSLVYFIDNKLNTLFTPLGDNDEDDMKATSTSEAEELSSKLSEESTSDVDSQTRDEFQLPTTRDYEPEFGLQTDPDELLMTSQNNAQWEIRLDW